MRAPLLLANVAVTAVGAWGLLRVILGLPANMPYAVDMFLRMTLEISGNDALANPDDMEMLSLLLYLCVSVTVAGSAVLACNLAFYRYIVKRRGGQ